MDSFFSRYRNGLVLGLVLLAQVIGLAVQVRRPVPNAADGRSVRLLRYWMISIIGPPERVAHSTGLGIRGIWSNYIDLRHARQRNRELQAEVDRLRLEQGGLAEDARQGHRLQHLLAFKEHYIYSTVVAQVIGTSGSDISRIVMIDKGSKDGLGIDMPVITPDGIVGKIREVFPHSAQVLEISDQSSGAGVMLETTRVRGVLRGNAYGQPQIINIMPDERIQPGERVLTSGGDQVYPRGMTVGYVDKVVNDAERNPYIDVVIRPAANLSRLEEVLVITNTGDTMPPGEQKDVAQSEADASRHSAADVLSDKLPGLKDPDNPNSVSAQEAADAATSEGDVARPVRPPPPLRPDRFTPGATPDANVLVPAQPMPHAPHNPPPAAAPPTGSSSPPALPVKKIVPPVAGPQPTGTQPTGTQSAGTPGAHAAKPAATNPPSPGLARTNPDSTTSPEKKPTANLTHPPAAAPKQASPKPANVGAEPSAAQATETATPAVQAPAATPASSKGITRIPIPGGGYRTIVNDGPDPNRRKATPPVKKTPAPGSNGAPGSAPAKSPKPASPNSTTPPGGR
jgi:rod shape-determining protein MreC